MRLMPTVGRTMVNDHFSHLTDGVRIESPFIWECTRFCLARDAGPGVAAALMLAGGEVMRGFGVEHYVGVFDARMVRIYRMIGASPEIVGSQGTGADRISVGLWDFTPEAQARVAQRAGVSPEQIGHVVFGNVINTEPRDMYLSRVAAIQAGKDVYVEKPLSHVFNEGPLMVAAAKLHGRIVQQGTHSELVARGGLYAQLAKLQFDAPRSDTA